jgi:hypothetical protein
MQYRHDTTVVEGLDGVRTRGEGEYRADRDDSALREHFPHKWLHRIAASLAAIRVLATQLCSYAAYNMLLMHIKHSFRCLLINKCIFKAA